MKDRKVLHWLFANRSFTVTLKEDSYCSLTRRFLSYSKRIARYTGAYTFYHYIKLYR